MKQMILQSLIEYARILWDMICKEADREVIYDDVIGIYDNIWERKELFYHRDNTRAMHWNITMSNITLSKTH